MKKAEPQKKNFETSLSSLEQIVRELERGDLPLEDSLKLFEDGVRLARECQERLNQAERRIEVLMRDSDGRPVVSGFESGEANKSDLLDVETSDDESVF
jgi:exodeoxyribonuclease VII small subunit